jgi:D-aminopeptidase
MRYRDLGLTLGRLPTGPWNALTDVPGVRVGHATLIRGEGPLRVGEGPVRTGVTAIHPHAGSAFAQTVPAAIQILNGAGEITGRSQVDEYGTLETPIVLTNTLSVGEAHRAVVDWVARDEALSNDFVIPVVAETCDAFLNDIVGQHVRAEHVFAALDGAASGPVAEGNVGGGTGMGLFPFEFSRYAACPRTC